MLVQTFANHATLVAFITFTIQIVLCIPMIIFERFTANKSAIDTIELSMQKNRKHALFTKFKSVHDYATCIFFIYLFFYSIYHAAVITHWSEFGEYSDESFAFLIIGSIITLLNGASLIFIGSYYMKDIIKNIKSSHQSKNKQDYKKAWIILFESLYEIFIGIILLLLSAQWLVYTFGSSTHPLIDPASFKIIKYVFLYIIAAVSFAAGLIGLVWIKPVCSNWIKQYKNKEISQWELIIYVGKSICLLIVVLNFGCIATSASLM